MAHRVLRITVAVVLLSLGGQVSAPGQVSAAPPPPGGPSGGLPSEMPAKFEQVTDRFDHVRKEVMIPMRDGVRLFTVILVPRGAKSAPILLTRTPYDAASLTSHTHSSHMAPNLYGYDNATDVIVDGGYIRVVQDVRGKHGSEGDYVMNRPLHGPLNPTAVDHATDTYDTIEWLTKNVPETNGKVGILGISYDGFTPLMALVHPHPALKVSVPMNPMVDGWMGDDWFHNGAFRQMGSMDYIQDQEADRRSEVKWWRSAFDDYQAYLEGGSAGAIAKAHGLEQVGFWRKILEHPAYDAFWQKQALDKVLAAEPLAVPMLLVQSLWDQEDIYGATAVYKALKPLDKAGDKVFLAMGPWYHGQEIGDGSHLGPIKFDSDTALAFRRDVLRPFLDHYLKDGSPAADVAPVTAFETGTNVWRKLPSWPAGKGTPFYLGADGHAGFSAPRAGDGAYTEYVSDPARPIPFRQRPVPPGDWEDNNAWRTWLVQDQREAASRPDVAMFETEVLKAPVKISGQPLVNLVASTSGTDSDWVVKVIDVYPDEVANDPPMGGYELMVSADIFRGRYREGYETAKPIAAGKPLLYKWLLPTANHVFLPGHKIMVQVQSTWFPLYDRNPQTFVPSIFWAKPGDYKKATQRVYHGAGQQSFVELPVVAP